MLWQGVEVQAPVHAHSVDKEQCKTHIGGSLKEGVSMVEVNALAQQS
jgi:hypothetical protein